MSRTTRALWLSAVLALAASCTGGPSAGTAATSPATTSSTTTNASTITTSTPSTTTTTSPPPLLGDPWPQLPLLDVAQAHDGDLLIAGPDGVMLVRDGEPSGLLYEKSAQVAVPEGLGGVVCQLPFRVDDAGNDNLWWLRGTGGDEAVGVPNVPLGSFRLQQVEWLPRLGRNEEGAWNPTYIGLTALFADSEHHATGALVTTGDPEWVTEHWEITLPAEPPTAPGPWWSTNPSARTWTGRHLVEAVYGSEGTRLEFRRVDGTSDVLPYNPWPDFAPGWIGNLDAEPGSPLLAYTVAANRQDFGITTDLHVVDLTDGREVLSLPIAGEDERVVRLDLHGGAVAVSTRRQVPGGVSMGVVRLVDLATGTIDTLPWGGTASFFYTAAPLPAASYPAVASELPELVVTAPREGAVVDQGILRFEGYTTPGAEVTTAGRYPVAVDAEGHWSTTLTLNVGGNMAVFAAAFPGGPPAETARVVFRDTGPEMGYAFDTGYERGDQPTWVIGVWVHDHVSEQRLAGATVDLALFGVSEEDQELWVTLATDDLGRAIYRIPIVNRHIEACLAAVNLEGYPEVPRLFGADQREGVVECRWVDFP
jgi:hypothetical protein